jgi:septum formation protein
MGTPIPPSITSKNVILASNSPRRRELLHKIIHNFTIAPSRDVDESFPADIPAHNVAQYISAKKAAAYADLVDENTMLITADTVVLCNGEILGKPKDAHDAADMLRRLSAHEHSVTTGFTIKTFEREVSFTEETFVTFAELSDSEISDYIDIFAPFDKAGAYGIQEWIGCIAISQIKGCFYNVMGLPLHKLYRAIKSF